MIIIKLTVNKINSTFISEKLYLTDAIQEMLRALKKVFGECKFKIHDISGHIPAPKIEEKTYLERFTEVVITKSKFKLK
jgi:hypothetical protein